MLYTACCTLPRSMRVAALLLMLVTSTFWAGTQQACTAQPSTAPAAAAPMCVPRPAGEAEFGEARLQHARAVRRLRGRAERAPGVAGRHGARVAQHELALVAEPTRHQAERERRRVCLRAGRCAWLQPALAWSRALQRGQAGTCSVYTTGSFNLVLNHVLARGAMTPRGQRTFTAGGTTRPRTSRRTGAAAPSTAHWNVCEKSPSASPTMRARTACGARGSRLPPPPPPPTERCGATRVFFCFVVFFFPALRRGHASAWLQGRQPGQQSRPGRTSAAPAASTPPAGSSAKRGAPGAAACGSSWKAASMDPLRGGRIHAGELAAASSIVATAVNPNPRARLAQHPRRGTACCEKRGMRRT